MSPSAAIDIKESKPKLAMPSHEEMIAFQAAEHELVVPGVFFSREEYVLYLIHKSAYELAAKLSKNARVLDLGCNSGYGAAIMSESRGEIVGADVSPKSISKAESLYGSRGIRFELINGKELPFKNNEFDLIVSFQVIEHIVDHRSYLGEIKRVLSPDGLAMFTTPNASLRLSAGMKPWNPFHALEFNALQLKSLLSDFFQATNLVGLSAREPLYSIEINRLKKIRAKAEKRRKIKKLFPKHIFNRINKIRRALSGYLKNDKRPVELDPDFINDRDSERLFYSVDNLDASLDLTAFCADDRNNARLSEALKMVAGTDQPNKR